MSVLNETIAKRVAKFFRLLGSDFDGEVLNAARRMKALLQAEGINFNDIATVIENHAGEIEERRYSDADAQIIFEKGLAKGRAEGASAPQAPPEFYDEDGQPRWLEIAMFCQRNDAKLKSEWEHKFIAEMPANLIKYDRPTPKQAKHLIAIFISLGGYYDPKTANVPF